MAYSEHDLTTFNGNFEPPPDNPLYPGVGRPRALRPVAPGTAQNGVWSGIANNFQAGVQNAPAAQQPWQPFGGLFRNMFTGGAGNQPTVAPTLPNPGPLAQAFPGLGQWQANRQSRRAEWATNHPNSGPRGGLVSALMQRRFGGGG